MSGEAGALPGGVRDLDQEGAHARAVAVMVGAEHAVFGLAEGQRQAVEDLAGAVPDEAVGTQVGLGAELGLVLVAHPRERAVGADHQVGTGQRRIIERRHLAVELDSYAQRLGMGVQRLSNSSRPIAAKPLPVIGTGVSLCTMVRLGQVSIKRRQQLVHRLVVGAQELQRPVGEHHAETPGRVARAALEHHDVMRRILALHQRAK
jgi:hypothetical protein